jgi:hypothetical protein
MAHPSDMTQVGQLMEEPLKSKKVEETCHCITPESGGNRGIDSLHSH